MWNRGRLFVSLAAVLWYGAALSPVAQADIFDLLVTQTPAGPANQDPQTWGAVLVYQLADAGAPATDQPDIPATALSDPAGLAWRSDSSEVFVGNRHGNLGVGSIGRFILDPGTGTLTPNGSITGNGLSGVHEVTFNPINGELFAANVTNGISRFLFDGLGNAVANGQLIAGQATRGVLVSPDGSRLYVTTAANVIRQFDLTNNSELPSVVVPGAASLHGLGLRGTSDLYAADFFAGGVFRFSVDGSNNLTPNGVVSVTQPLGVAFSPDGQEMYVPRHGASTQLDRFLHDGNTDSWVSNGAIVVGTSLGAALTILVPEPASLLLLLPAAAILIRRSRR